MTSVQNPLLRQLTKGAATGHWGDRPGIIVTAHPYNIAVQMGFVIEPCNVNTLAEYKSQVQRVEGIKVRVTIGCIF